MPDQDEYLYGPAVSKGGSATLGVASNVTWDSFVRQLRIPPIMSAQIARS